MFKINCSLREKFYFSPVAVPMNEEQNKFDQNFSIVYNHLLSAYKQPLFPGVSELILNLQQGGLINLHRKV
jgi:hypothetical protein